MLLTKVEALGYAADRLSRQAADMELIGMITDSMKKVELPADARAHLAELRSIAPEPQLQAQAMRAAAGAIRDLALEERLVEARVRASSDAGGGR